MVWWVIVGCFFLVICLLLVFYISCHLICSCTDQQLVINIVYSYLGFCFVRKEYIFTFGEAIKRWERVAEYKADKEQLQGYLTRLNKRYNDVSFLLGKAKIKKINWSTEIGVKEADHTAILTGVIWSAKGLFLHMLSRKCKQIDEPRLFVTPNFQNKVMRTEVNCMIKVRFGQAIYTLIKA